KEDVFSLYGFYTEKEKQVFHVLLKASGVGPKLAITILSNLDADTLKRAVAQQDVALLTSINGVGKKRAEKLVFDLKEKFAAIYDETDVKASGAVSNITGDALLALKSLGYSHDEALKMVRRVKADEKMTLEELIRKALGS